MVGANKDFVPSRTYSLKEGWRVYELFRGQHSLDADVKGIVYTIRMNARPP
jgi:hypothetical protein